MRISHILDRFKDPPRFKRYVEKTIKKRKNGTRTFFNVVHPPNDTMAAIHEELIKLLTEKLSPFGSSLRNAIAVTGVTSTYIFNKLETKRFIFKMDLFHAYGSVKLVALASILKNLFPSWGSEATIANFLRKYCCDEKLGLFYGAPASPLLFNLYCEEMLDKKIRKATWKFQDAGIGYMRYMDDLIFFSRDNDIPRDFLWSVRAIIAEAGFFENQWKAKAADRRKGPIIVLGRQLGCLVSALDPWRRSSRSKIVERKNELLAHSIDPRYKGLPRRVVGMPSASINQNIDPKKSLEALEIEMYRAATLGGVEKPFSLAGKMMWFVDSICPRGRTLSRVELKIVRHYLNWAPRSGLPVGFLEKLDLPARLIRKINKYARK